VISSGAERAVVLGDAIHCPIEISAPELDFVFDVDPVLARQTKERIEKELEQSNTGGGRRPLPRPRVRASRAGRRRSTTGLCAEPGRRGVSRFDGKLAVVAGGSSGIGSACVELLQREGAKVVVLDLADAQPAGEHHGRRRLSRGSSTTCRTHPTSP
jgi:hypothetical protein